MRIQEDRIYFGFFKDFNNPTILFSGNAKGFALFRDLFRGPAIKIGSSVSFGEMPVFIKSNVDVVLKVSSKATGMKINNDKLFEWGLSPKECKLFAKELNIFASAKDGDDFHQYLDCGSMDDVEVVISVGEYTPDMFKKM